MPLRKKLILAMLVPAVLLGAVGGIGIYSLRHLEQAAGRILANNYKSIQEVRRMERALPQSGAQEIIRSSFLIDEQGRVQAAWYKVKPEATVPNALDQVA